MRRVHWECHIGLADTYACCNRRQSFALQSLPVIPACCPQQNTYVHVEPPLHSADQPQAHVGGWSNRLSRRQQPKFGTLDVSWSAEAWVTAMHQYLNQVDDYRKAMLRVRLAQGWAEGVLRLSLTQGRCGLLASTNVLAPGEHLVQALQPPSR